MTEIIARREFSPLYIWLDIAFLLLFAALLIWKKKYMTILVGALAGILYMIVDFGIFHLVCQLAQHIGRSQSFLGAAVDVGELRIHQFCVDMALVIKRRTSFRVVVSDTPLVVRLPAAFKNVHTCGDGEYRHSAHDR